MVSAAPAVAARRSSWPRPPSMARASSACVGVSSTISTRATVWFIRLAFSTWLVHPPGSFIRLAPGVSEVAQCGQRDGGRQSGSPPAAAGSMAARSMAARASCSTRDGADGGGSAGDAVGRAPPPRGIAGLSGRGQGSHQPLHVGVECLHHEAQVRRRQVGGELGQNVRIKSVIGSNPLCPGRTPAVPGAPRAPAGRAVARLAYGRGQ